MDPGVGFHLDENQILAPPRMHRKTFHCSDFHCNSSVTENLENKKVVYLAHCEPVNTVATSSCVQPASAKTFGLFM